MIEEIYPHRFYNQYQPRLPLPSDRILMFKNERIAMVQDGEGMDYPRYAQCRCLCQASSSIFFTSMKTLIF